MAIVMTDCDKIIQFLSCVRKELSIVNHRKVFTQRPLIPEKLHNLNIEHAAFREIVRHFPQSFVEVHKARSSEEKTAMMAFQWVLNCDNRQFTLEGETTPLKVKRWLRSELVRRGMTETIPGVYDIQEKPLSEIDQIRSRSAWIDEGMNSIVSRLIIAPSLELNSPAATAAPSSVRRM